MADICIICGSELVNGACPNGPHLKKMCYNCKDCKETADNDESLYKCYSQKNMDKALEKIKESVPDLGYSITLEPLPLKNPSKKCPFYVPDEERILAVLLPTTK